MVVVVYFRVSREETETICGYTFLEVLAESAGPFWVWCGVNCFCSEKAQRWVEGDTYGCPQHLLACYYCVADHQLDHPIQLDEGVDYMHIHAG